jgi:hypothetical protein
MDALIESWHTLAHCMRELGVEIAARSLERCARELARALELDKLESITLEEASTQSGYTYSAIQKKVATGQLANLGVKGRPRVRKGDLPRKAPKHSAGIADSILLNRSH